MKKLFCLLFLCVLFVGCGADKTKETFEEYAKTYYTNHMSMTNSESVFVSKSMLKDASDEDGYDMEKLSECTNSSKITFSIQDKKIVKTEYELDCK